MITPSARTAENVYTWILVIAVILLILSIPWLIERAFHKEQPGPESGELIPVDSSIVEETMARSVSWIGSDTPSVHYRLVDNCMPYGRMMIFKVTNNTPQTVKLPEFKIIITP